VLNLQPGRLGPSAQAMAAFEAGWPDRSIMGGIGPGLHCGNEFSFSPAIGGASSKSQGLFRVHCGRRCVNGIVRLRGR